MPIHIDSACPRDFGEMGVASVARGCQLLHFSRARSLPAPTTAGVDAEARARTG